MHVTSSPLITGFSLVSFVIVQTWPYVIVISWISRNWLYTLYRKRTEVDVRKYGNMTWKRETGTFSFGRSFSRSIKSDFHNFAHLQAPTANRFSFQQSSFRGQAERYRVLSRNHRKDAPIFARNTYLGVESTSGTLQSSVVRKFDARTYLRTYVPIYVSKRLIYWLIAIDRSIDWVTDWCVKDG